MSDAAATTVLQGRLPGDNCACIVPADQTTRSLVERGAAGPMAQLLPRRVLENRALRDQPIRRCSLKIGRLTIVASACLAFVGVAHAQGAHAANANPLHVFWTQLSAHAAYKAGATPRRNVQIIRASWYGGGERLSRRTSTGEIFHPMGLTAAHRTLPFGTLLRVSCPSTGRSTVVRINDRGPAASTGRALDLSRGAALNLGIAGRGEAKVAIEVMR